eukprot:TRINITY_DN26063_c0_g1_i1.p1 TRINITY_DN26063_c0_g1~~TRINITY_DN26063_c0_g1_i1.p1  ORF type:complete len:256 (+),score=73.44 TRINITY_DN26063_c0_g1_i1:47-814(+)
MEEHILHFETSANVLEGKENLAGEVASRNHDLEELHADVRLKQGLTPEQYEKAKRAENKRFEAAAQARIKEENRSRSQSVYTDEDLKHAFEDIDDNDDGYLSYEELRDLLLKGNPDFAEKTLRLLWRKVDKDHNEKVDFEELVDYLHGKKSKTPKEKWQDTFYAFAGVDDQMQLHEFQKLCSQTGLCNQGFSEEEAVEIFQTLCGDGVMTCRDFSKATARIAKKKGIKRNDVRKLIKQAEGPSAADITYETLLDK